MNESRYGRRALAIAGLALTLGGISAGVASADPIPGVDHTPLPPAVIDDDGFVNYDYSTYPLPPTWPAGSTWPEDSSYPGVCAITVHCDKPA